MKIEAHRKLSYWVAGIIGFLGFGTITAQAQNPTEKGYWVGDTLPEIQVAGFLDDPDAAPATLADFYRGKLLLVDFWATWCTPCVPGLEELSQLKTEFDGQLEVLGVTYQPPHDVNAYRTRTGRLLGLTFPLIAGDTLLGKHVFPHRGLPHIAWIDSAGVVIAITNKNEVTKANIKRAIAGTYRTAQKADLRDFSGEDTFHAMDSAFLGRSIITPYFPGVSGRTGFYPKGFKPDSLQRFLAMNVPPYLLFRMAAFGNNMAFGNDSRLVFEVRDSTRFFVPTKTPRSFEAKYTGYNEWRAFNTYCYELDLPSKVPVARFREYMINDLNRYFNVHARFEKRLIDCWVLTRQAGNEVLMPSRVSGADRKVVFKASIFRAMYGQPVQVLVDGLNNMIADGHIVDDTGIDYPIDIEWDVPINNRSIAGLNELLSEYGLALTAAKREVDVFVVTELD